MKILIPLTHTDVYKSSPPIDYIHIVSQYSKSDLLRGLSFLIPKAEKYLRQVSKGNDTSIHLQFLQLFELETETLHSSLRKLAGVEGAINISIARDSILYAIEEILQSDLVHSEPSFAQDRVFKNAIFKFLLCMNEIYIKAGELKDKFNLEDLNAAIIPSNNIPLHTGLSCLIKAKGLFNYFLTNEILKDPFNHYIQDYYKCNVKQYLGFYFRWGFSEGCTVTEIENMPELSVFNRISSLNFRKKEVIQLNTLKIHPIFKVSTNDFIILDKQILLARSYYQLIYEFWFNCIKSKKISAKIYFGLIGRYFEDYCSGLLKNLFSHLEHPKCLSLTELEYQDGTGMKEYIDFYAREQKKIVLAEFKLGNINDEERYKGTTEALYSKGRQYFYRNLSQLKLAIENLDLVKSKFDKKLPIEKKLTVYPLCVFNDRIYELHSMKIAYSSVWDEIRKAFKDIEVKPLIILQIEELEEFRRLDNKVRKKEIWHIFNRFCKTKGKYRDFSLARLFDYKLNYDNTLKNELQELVQQYN